MPRGGFKCPDCGRRFHERQDLIKAESKIKGFPSNEQERAYLCPGVSAKTKAFRHSPQIVKIQRINVSDVSHLVKMKIIQVETAELLEEYIDQMHQANLRKFRPDLVLSR